MVVRTLLRAVPSRMAECADSLPKPNDYLMINGYRFVSVFWLWKLCALLESGLLAAWRRDAFEQARLFLFITPNTLHTRR